jgi:hypothetical protein
MPFIEAPTNFYLGHRYDPATHMNTDDVVYYDSRDLTTHAVVLGMTGSGKTGLCITLLEEAILDNIPAIVIDPKGDITNLLLTFPDLQPSDFEPWVNVDDARRAGLDIHAYAADVAHTWQTGLEKWGIVPDRLRWMKQATRYSIYTPGSDAGLPISILASLRAPREGWAGNEEANRERINGVVTALLALVGRNAKPVQDKEHVLIANIFEYAWQRGQDLSLEDIIVQIQKPPFSKLGVFAVDEYMSEKDRYKLAMEMNSIIAAPSFQSWINGEPMDIQSLLYQPDGRPRVSIFYIAHLSEPERLFIVTLLLENMLGWMRGLSGTTSLRALLYIDETFGYFPPYPRNPPTKDPMLRLLKQARAFGVGLILATQNPGDLDYKGLSNAGTWFIGRLQSENDKNRVMTGLQSMVSVDTDMDIKSIERLISDIEPRVFLMHNVHNQSGPIMMHTRWAMSYLRGPLTRQQVQFLMASQRQHLLNQRAAQFAGASAAASGGTGAYSQFAAPSAPAYPSAPPPPAFSTPPPSVPGMPPSLPGFPEPPPGLPEIPTQTAPVLPSEPLSYTQSSAPIRASTAGVPGAQLPPGFSVNQPPVPSTTPQYFLPQTVTSQQAISAWEQRTNFAAQAFGGAMLAYKPVLLAQATMRYSDRKTQIYTSRSYAYHVPDVDRAGIVHWEEYTAQPVDSRRVSGEPFGQAIFGDVTPGLTDAKRQAQLKREFGDMLYNTVRLKVPYNSALDIYGNPDADFSEFRARATQIARERRDAEIDALTTKYETIMDRLDENMRKTAQKLDTEKRELAEQKREELFTTGEAILGLLKGRTSFTLSRMSRSALYRKRSAGDVQLYQQGLTEVDEKIAKAEQEFEANLKQINDKWARIAQQVEEYIITPFKKDISVDLFGIGWIPFWYVALNGQPLMLPAYV